MLIKNSPFILLLFLTGSALAQVNRYVVYFKDKIGTPYSLAQPEKFLSAASIGRRAKRQISYVNEDLPVNPLFITKVKSVGAKTFFTSRWLNCVLVECTASVSLSIKQLPEVSSVEYVAPGNRLLGGRIAKELGSSAVAGSQSTLSQFQQLGIDQMQTAGFRGEGINIAIFDGGFSGVDKAQPFQNVFLQNRIKDTYNFVVNTKYVYSYDQHGTQVFSILAAQSTNFTGGAVAANYFLFVTEDVPTEYRVEEYNWLFAAERADSLGVDIISSSLGYSTFDDISMDYSKSNLDGKTAIVSRAAAKAIAKGMMVVNSAGNQGNDSWKQITPPADVNGILTVGSINSQQSLSSFSSVGPTADGRIKPDVVALGSATTVFNSQGTQTTNSGTSFSCPLITCLAAGVWQAYPSLSVNQLYWAIVRSGNQFNAPDFLKGYGLPNFNGVESYLQSIAIEENIAVSPNPLTDNVMKVFFKEPKEGEISVTVYDLQGRILLTVNTQTSWQNNPLDFDLSSLASGIYVVQVNAPGSSLTTRLIKI